MIFIGFFFVAKLIAFPTRKKIVLQHLKLKKIPTVAFIYYKTQLEKAFFSSGKNIFVKQPLQELSWMQLWITLCLNAVSLFLWVVHNRFSVCLFDEWISLPKHSHFKKSSYCFNTSFIMSCVKKKKILFRFLSLTTRVFSAISPTGDDMWRDVFLFQQFCLGCTLIQ